MWKQLAGTGVLLFSGFTAFIVWRMSIGAIPMKDQLDWSKLPPNLAYLIEPAEKYGSLQFDDRIYELLRGMSPAEKAELEALLPKYAADQAKIDAWIDEYRMTEHREAALVYFLGYMLISGNDDGYLSVKKPWNIGAIPMKEQLDWSKLPPNLAYLIEPAEKYGRLQFDDRIYEFLRGMSPAEKAELETLFPKCVANGVQIEAWLDKYRITEHREAALVYSLSCLLSTAGDDGFIQKAP